LTKRAFEEAARAVAVSSATSTAVCDASRNSRGQADAANDPGSNPAGVLLSIGRIVHGRRIATSRIGNPAQSSDFSRWP
jgi:hypothetical protein